MANKYVDSNAVGTGTGADWANAYTTLKASAEAAGTAAGDTHYVAHNHAETAGAELSITFKGTLAAPDRVLCVNSAGTVPPVSADLRTTGTITVTGAFGITWTGCAYFYGLTVTCASGATSQDFTLGGTTQTDFRFDACALRLGGTSGGRLFLGSLSNNVTTRVVYVNSTYQVAAANAVIVLARGVSLLWKNTTAAITGATIPTELFGAYAQGSGTAILDGVDLVALSTKTLVADQVSGGQYYFKDCKFPASLTINAVLTNAGAQVFVIRSASGATAYNLEKHDARGNQVIETTIVRTGGATVNSTGVAMKMTALANAKFQAPFESTPLVVNNTTVAANRTVTVYGVWAGAAVPNNDEVWMEVGYLGSAATPQLTFNSNSKADVLATAAAQSTDTSTWGGGTTKFKLVATLSAPQPQLAGDMYVVVKSASTNATYIDPVPVLS